MSRRIMQDATEVLRWMDEGKTYSWMVDEYERKYNLQVTESLFATFRYRQGLSTRITRDRSLLPWRVLTEHSGKMAPQMLRAEARLRAGSKVADARMKTLTAWKKRLVDEGLVVHYDPDTEQGFWYVPAREGIDVDLVRVPDDMPA